MGCWSASGSDRIVTTRRYTAAMVVMIVALIASAALGLEGLLAQRPGVKFL